MKLLQDTKPEESVSHMPPHRSPPSPSHPYFSGRKLHPFVCISCPPSLLLTALHIDFHSIQHLTPPLPPPYSVSLSPLASSLHEDVLNTPPASINTHQTHTHTHMHYTHDPFYVNSLQLSVLNHITPSPLSHPLPDQSLLHPLRPGSRTHHSRDPTLTNYISFLWLPQVNTKWWLKTTEMHSLTVLEVRV